MARGDEEEERKTTQFSEKQRGETRGERGGREGRKNLSLPLSPCTPAPNTQVPDSFGEKTSLQTHSDFWEAAQLRSLSSLPFRGWELALRRFPGVAGVGGGRKLGMGTRRGAHACQEPARPQVFSSCLGGRVSTFRTPPGSSGR